MDIMAGTKIDDFACNHIRENECAQAFSAVIFPRVVAITKDPGVRYLLIRRWFSRLLAQQFTHSFDNVGRRVHQILRHCFHFIPSREIDLESPLLRLC